MHGTFYNMLKGLPGAEDVVMGLDADLRHGQNSAPACQPDQPNTERMSSGVTWVEAAASVRHDSCDRAEDCPTSEQPDDMLDDNAVDAFRAPAP